LKYTLKMGTVIQNWIVLWKWRRLFEKWNRQKMNTCQRLKCILKMEEACSGFKSALKVEKAHSGFILPWKWRQFLSVEEYAEKNEISLQIEATCSFEN
jgi:hypothetical protein